MNDLLIKTNKQIEIMEIFDYLVDNQINSSKIDVYKNSYNRISRSFQKYLNDSNFLFSKVGKLPTYINTKKIDKNYELEKEVMIYLDTYLDSNLEFLESVQKETKIYIKEKKDFQLYNKEIKIYRDYLANIVNEIKHEQPFVSPFNLIYKKNNEHTDINYGFCVLKSKNGRMSPVESIHKKYYDNIENKSLDTAISFNYLFKILTYNTFKILEISSLFLKKNLLLNKVKFKNNNDASDKFLKEINVFFTFLSNIKMFYFPDEANQNKNIKIKKDNYKIIIKYNSLNKIKNQKNRSYVINFGLLKEKYTSKYSIPYYYNNLDSDIKFEKGA